jgi:putative SOS response-associated peptidase YedK
VCGRFVQYSPLETLQNVFSVGKVVFEAVPNYNVAPSQNILAVVKHDNKNKLERLYWGLVPFWAKDVSIGSRMINARLETVSEKPSFRNAFKKRRCLIPADGFYEWKGEPGHKQPFFVTTDADEPFAFAGLWETWTKKESADKVVYKSCTIITTEARGPIGEIHKRMPVLLLPDFYEKWLNTEAQDPKKLGKILQDGIIDDVRFYPVSTYVNSVKNNDSSCLEPIRQQNLGHKR